MPPDSYVDWGAVHFYTPLNRTGEQILTDEEKSKGCPVSDTLVVSEGFVGVKMRAILGKINGRSHLAPAVYLSLYYPPFSHPRKILCKLNLSTC